MFLLRETLEKGPEDDKETANGRSLLSAEAVGYVWRKEKDEETTEAWDGAENTKSTTGRMVENCEQHLISQFTVVTSPSLGLHLCQVSIVWSPLRRLPS